MCKLRNRTYKARILLVIPVVILSNIYAASLVTILKDFSLVKEVAPNCVYL